MPEASPCVGNVASAPSICKFGRYDALQGPLQVGPQFINCPKTSPQARFPPGLPGFAAGLKSSSDQALW